MSAQIIALFMNTIVSVLVLAKTESFLQFRYRFRPKTEMAVSASFGFGRNEKKSFGGTLLYRFQKMWIFSMSSSSSSKV